MRIAKDGADGLQIDKTVASALLDFNPLNTRKPDEAMTQGLVDGIERVYRKCKAVNPDFCLASEAVQDRLILYVDVFYRAAAGFSISPLRYAFPEWTACLHMGAARDFNTVNSAVMLGAVLCVEPQCYQAIARAPTLCGYRPLHQGNRANSTGAARHHLHSRLLRHAGGHNNRGAGHTP